MSSDLRKYDWVLRPYRYSSVDDLVSNLRAQIIDVAEVKRVEIQSRRATEEW